MNGNERSAERFEDNRLTCGRIRSRIPALVNSA